MNFFVFFSKIKEKIKQLFSTKKKTILIGVATIVVVILFLIPSFTTNKDVKNKDAKTEVNSISNFSKNVEDKLQSMLLKISDISSASVMVMVESTPKIEYLTENEEVTEIDEKGSSSTKSTTVVFEKNGSLSTPVVVTTIMPKIAGVLIVVNKVSASTKLSIINSVSVVLNIDPTCISILQES